MAVTVRPRSGSAPQGYHIHGGTGGFSYQPSSGTSPGIAPAADAAGILKAINERLSKIGVWPVPIAVAAVNERLSKIGVWPVPIAVAAVAALILFGLGPAYAPFGLLVAVIGAGMAYWLYRQDNIRYTIELMYNLDQSVSDVFQEFISGFDELSKTNKAMNIEMKGEIYDWKHHGGAAFEVVTVPARFGYGVPKRVQTNIAVPYIGGGSSTLYFFPDQLLIHQGGRVDGLDYRSVAIAFHDQQFHETAAVPEDAAVVGSTWQFVRRDGGPDRRFKDNREIPIVNYQAMVIDAPRNFQKVLYLSKNIARAGFLTAVSSLADLHGRGTRAVGTSSTPSPA